MNNPTLSRGHVIEDSPFSLTARVEGFGTPYLQASQVQSISVSVFDKTAGQQVGTAFTVAPADAVLSTLQPWEEDRTGYNVLIAVPGSYVPIGGRTYRVEVRVTPAGATNAAPFYLPVWELDATEIMGG